MKKSSIGYVMNIILGVALLGCHNNTEQKKRFLELPPSHTQIDFINQVIDSSDFNIFGYRNFYNGGGVALGDLNNDGLSDIFLVSNLGSNKLYLNKGDFKFEDVTDNAGVKGSGAWSTGVTFADINGDGLLDIYVCNSGNRENDDRSNELFINMGNTTFTESAKEYGLADGGFSTHAAFFDYDRDGDLDMYLLNNSFIPVGKLNFRNFRMERDKLGGDKLFRNDGNKFTDVSEEAGIYGSIIGFGLGITIGDINDDNWLDIFISNDFYERDYLYINNQDGTFTEQIKDGFQHLSLSSMGADMADINNDGTLDVFVTDMLPRSDEHLKQTGSFEGYDLYQHKLSLDYYHQLSQNMLHMNNGDGTFSEVSRIAGVEATDWSWGALVFDMDNDGWKDIFVANGIWKDITDQDFLRYMADDNRIDQIAREKRFDYGEFLNNMPTRPTPNCAFKNMGNMNFQDEAPEWGVGGPGFSNGAAYGDLDNDGDLELVVNNENYPVSIFKNLSVEDDGAHFLRVKLLGTSHNRNGIGAKVILHRKGQRQYLQQMPNRGFQSSVDHILVFGLGVNNTSIDSLEVIWPDDQMKIYKNIKPDQDFVVNYTDADLTWKKKSESVKKPFRDITTTSNFNYTHKENTYADYYRDPLLKQMYSTQGPSLACGDVNADGLDDVFIGGAKGQPVTLFLQKLPGVFEFTKQTVFAEDSLAEDVASILVDVDNDSDLDLFVVTGSNEFSADDPLLRDRLYVNDGKGNFNKSDQLPNILSNASCVAAADFDKDGDVDLFIGGRIVSGKYGFNPSSYLYINDGNGSFKNYTKRYLPSQELGMVTDAVWADIDQDTYPELVVVGDWMPVTIFKNNKGKSLEKSELVNSDGWWNCIKEADIDGDGDIDLIVGNAGHNSKIRADSVYPAELYLSDFDHNGAVEQIISTKSHDGKNYPFVLKHDLEKQLPIIKKRFLKYSDYAGKSIDQIFTNEELKEATVKKVFNSSTSLLLNNGAGTFDIVALPWATQLSPIHAIEVLDFDNDGNVDIVLAGNFFDVLPEVGRYDANYGTVLHGEGKGKFKLLNPTTSGFFTTGQVRKMMAIRGTKSTLLVLAKNNDKVQVFEAGNVQEKPRD